MLSKNPARNTLKAELLRRGLTYKELAKRHGWNYHTVIMTVARHWGREGSLKGKIAREIISTLKSYISS